jgi:hypothetical protein
MKISDKFLVSDPFYINDYDDEPGYEYNRYPIPFDIPYDNLQLQQEYNTDDLPMDDDGPFLPVRFCSIHLSLS